MISSIKSIMLGNTSMTCFAIGENKINLAHPEFGKGLAALRELKYLDISGNVYKEDSLKELGGAFSSIMQLKSLDFSNINFNLIQIKKIAPFIKGFANLEMLDLSSNYLKDNGLLEVSRILPHLTQLSSLSNTLNRSQK